jgi:hypothetical protein
MIYESRNVQDWFVDVLPQKEAQAALALAAPPTTAIKQQQQQHSSQATKDKQHNGGE